MLVVEQDARIALNASSRAYVLEVGRVALTGTSKELRDDVRPSWVLGVSSDHIIHAPGGCKAAPGCVPVASIPTGAFRSPQTWRCGLRRH